MRDLTQGPIRGHVLHMTLVMLFGMVVQTLYSLIDIYWAGRLGAQAVAAVSIASNLTFVVIGVSQMLAVGTVALVSQAAGRKDLVAVQRSFNQSQVLSLLTGVVFLIVGWLAIDPYAQGLAGDAATAALMKEFLAWFIPGMALQFAMVGLTAALRGVGVVRPGVIAQVVSVVLNILFAPFLMFGWLGAPALGVAGAGLATFLATLIVVAGLAVYLLRGHSYLKVSFVDWRPDWRLWGRLLGIGLPAGTEFLLMTALMGFIYAVIAPFGASAQAGFGIGLRIMQAGFMPAVCLSFAVAAVAGQNYGAGQPDRVRRTFFEGAWLNVAFMLVFTVLCHLAPNRMMGVFSADPVVIAVGADYLRMISYNYVAFGLAVVAGGIFQGMGNAWPSLVASASRMAVFVTVVLWLAKQPGFHLHQVWIVSVASVVFQMAVSLVLLRREFARRLGPRVAPVLALDTP